MDRDPFAHLMPAPASGWGSWAPELAEAPDTPSDEAPVTWWSAAVPLLMWGCASLLALSYL
ncbi:hypothetical protein [Ramlibacter humi]|uniref:Uncharacterized protein n=1 Tax=Ramlibacter humi TaxID=2530451 RepID=A0A4Z0BZP8_9BURK|nr:hypothetical protein [Ramlibacter humi]TFZ03788.1 hypothetical protein EZ216_09035 [Ramlibacter humi]